MTNVPWHYTPFHLLVTTPLCLLLLIGLSAFAWRSARRCRPELVDLVWTGTVWVGSLLLIEQLATARYDGIRHYLMILVGASLLAGAGAEWVLQTVAAAVRAAKRPALAAPIAWATLGVLGLIVVLELVRAHPYESAYVNPVASLAAPRTEGWIELDYWGNSLKEGAAWLDRNAEPDARIHAPVLRHIARHYLGDRVSAEMPRAGFDDVSKPRYLLLLTRRAFYRAGVRAIVATREPVFAIRRGRGTLLEIYRNRAPRPSEL